MKRCRGNIGYRSKTVGRVYFLKGGDNEGSRVLKRRYEMILPITSLTIYIPSALPAGSMVLMWVHGFDVVGMVSSQNDSFESYMDSMASMKSMSR